jgi:hypothetical protein
MPDGLGTCLLYNWFSSSRGDHFTTSDPAWIGSVGEIRNSGDDYELMRIEGRVFSPAFKQPPGTVALWNFWNPRRGDNFLTSQPVWTSSPARDGYTRFRLEGYIYAAAGDDRRALNSYWNPLAEDNLATSAGPGELYSIDGRWGAYRTEGFLLPEIERVTPLYTWYSPARRDHFTTTDPAWAGVVGDHRESGDDYELMRLEGRVFSPDVPQPKGTIALWNFWNPDRGDNFLTTQPHWVRSRELAGYTRFRLEGFLHIEPGPGRAELVSSWNPKAEDNAATTARNGEIRSLSAEWGKYRREGFLFPHGELVHPADITDPLVPTAVLQGDREFGGHGPEGGAWPPGSTSSRSRPSPTGRPRRRPGRGPSTRRPRGVRFSPWPPRRAPRCGSSAPRQAFRSSSPARISPPPPSCSKRFRGTSSPH